MRQLKYHLLHFFLPEISINLATFRALSEFHIFQSIDLIGIIQREWQAWAKFPKGLGIIAKSHTVWAAIEGPG